MLKAIVSFPAFYSTVQIRTLLSRLLRRVEELADILAVQFDATIPPSFDQKGSQIVRFSQAPMSTIHPSQPGPLHYASLCGFRGLTEQLIAVHSLRVNSRGGSDTTALHAASVRGHLDVASIAALFKRCGS